MRPCGYCARMVRNDDTRHMLGSTRIECPISWKPWERYDFKAVKRGEWWIRFQPLPLYAYVAKHPTHGFQIIQPFQPYITAATHPKAWDAAAARIVHPA